MRLIGLYLREMHPMVIKTLSQGWYPFGDYRAPNSDGRIIWKKESNVMSQLYVRPGLPRISVQAIVGMNGSGKSTILDIIYRILNNLAFKLESERPTPIKHELSYAYGLNADMYCEVDDRIVCISCFDENLSFYRYSNGKKETLAVCDRTFDEILGSFFYTIGVNYSIYAFNKWEYKATDNEFIDGEWLHGVFHKNDGYLAPITLVPFREEGVIDIHKENELAKQRILALSILARANKRQFPAGYFPEVIDYSLNKSYKEQKLEFFIKQHKEFSAEMLKAVISSFEFAWDRVLEDANLKHLEHGTDEYNMAIFYLAYKTLKICFTYNDYYELFDINQLIRVCSNSDTSIFIEYQKKLLPSIANKVVSKIFRSNSDHITLKIHQCLTFMNNEFMDKLASIKVDEFIAFYNPKSYDDVVKNLYPPFYNFDVQFKKVGKKSVNSWDVSKNYIYLSQMSSGEKQLLYAISYVLYHLKNIQSVNKDKYRVPYHHVNIIMDEVELYFHPDYQRRLVSMLLSALSWSGVDRRKIRSINLMLATHSPFVLSDILIENSLYLVNGRRKRVSKQTFGGNYYNMLKGSFFFRESAIGAVASSNIRSWIDQKKYSGEVPSKELLDLVGDPFIKRFLELQTKD